jgi:hypothetical protein
MLFLQSIRKQKITFGSVLIRYFVCLNSPLLLDILMQVR